MDNQIAVYRPQPLTHGMWKFIMDVAPVIHKSRLFGVGSPEQAAAIMLKGHELWLPFTASFEFIQVVEGKPAISPRGALAMVLQSKLLADWDVKDETDACTVYMKRIDGSEYTLTFTMQDAKRAGIVKPSSNWEKWPKNMLRWRAIGFVIDVIFPDVIGGMKRTDEYGADLTPEGDTVIEGEVVPSLPEMPVKEIAAPTVTLGDLLEKYGPTMILHHNQGILPSTDEEVAALAQRLSEVVVDA